jgi:hypothetical protein
VGRPQLLPGGQGAAFQAVAPACSKSRGYDKVSLIQGYSSKLVLLLEGRSTQPLSCWVWDSLWVSVTVPDLEI